MAKLIVMSGLPGSGKTTYARNRVKADGNVIRVNRDDLRAMCFNSEFTGRREGIIIDIERAIAKIAKENNYSVVIDDTNLSRSDIWSSFARENGFEIEKVALRLKEDWPEVMNLVFGLLDRKSINDGIWKRLRPTYAKPFRVDVDS